MEPMSDTYPDITYVWAIQNIYFMYGNLYNSVYNYNHKIGRWEILKAGIGLSLLKSSQEHEKSYSGSE